MKIRSPLPLVLVPLAMLATLQLSAVAQDALKYPTTRKVDQVDTYHATAVPDPYRWLEDNNRPCRARTASRPATTRAVAAPPTCW